MRQEFTVAPRHRETPEPASVQFDGKYITIFGESVSYDPYYFAIAAEDEDTNYRTIVRQVLGQWAEALAQAKAEGETLHLPFGIHDQSVECFAAAANTERVTLRCVWVNVEGYSLNLRDLSAFMKSSPEVVKAYQEEFGEYSKAALVRALLEARSATI